MRNLKQTLISFLAVCAAMSVLVTTGCGQDLAAPQQVQPEKEPTVKFAEKPEEIVVQDKKAWYSDEDDYSVVTMYLTVREGSAGDGTNYTWEEVNAHSIFHYRELGIERYRVAGILQVGDENGPVRGMLGYNDLLPNAVVQVRGNTTSTSAQKSFKVEVYKGKGFWREQRTIILNKHIYDPVRFRNKLTYDVLKEMPGTISARSQFVHLFVKDQTGKKIANDEFVDYGLFTQVEQFNTRYLRNHGLDDGGHLYKAEMFEFYRYPDAIRLTTDPEYDYAKFERVVETKNNTDHSKFIQMIEDVNNILIPIEELFPKYFDAENYFTWMAFQILIDNIDTTSRNFYLYSPLNSLKWYFIAWDNDGGWRTEVDEDQLDIAGYETGMSNYWGVVLHQRVLKVEKYRKMLDDKVHELREYLSEERLAEKINKYSEVVYPYVYSTPDIGYARAKPDEYPQIVSEMPKLIEKNYQRYLESLKKPMPFFMGIPEITANNKLSFYWDTAFSLEEERITYQFLLSDSHLFDNIIARSDSLLLPGFEVDMLPYGQYFYRVIATDESGQSQASFDYYVDIKHLKHYGVIAFTIRPEGILIEEQRQRR